MTKNSVFWNAGDTDVKAGLDILGYRRWDQALEKVWVAGITTISPRARYLSILPWLLDHHYVRSLADSKDGSWTPKYEGTKDLFRRMEFLSIAATHADTGSLSEDRHGLIGSDLYSVALKEIGARPRPFKEASAGSSMEIYRAPCRSFNLIGNDIQGSRLPSLPDSSRSVIDSRVQAGIPNTCLEFLSHGGSVSNQLIEDAIPTFSMNALTRKENVQERDALLEALLCIEGARGKAFRGTLGWCLERMEKCEGNAGELIQWNFVSVLKNPNEASELEQAWAEYELHRRVHFSMEVLLSSVRELVKDEPGISRSRISQQMIKGSRPGQALLDGMGKSEFSWGMTLASFEDALSDDWLDREAPNWRQPRRIPATSSPSFCLAIVVSMSRLAGRLELDRSRVEFKNSGISQLVEHLQDKSSSLAVVLHNVLQHGVIEAHLRTTLRKMSQNLSCSLRFFPDGDGLRPTVQGVKPGRSGSRLDNVLQILKDLGIWKQHSEGTELTQLGHDVLKRLRG